MPLGPRPRSRRPAGLTPAAAAIALALSIAAAACADGGVVATDPAPAEPAEPVVDSQWVRARFLTDSTAVVAGDTLAIHRETLPFYRARVFAAAWGDRAARDTITVAIGAVEDEGIRSSDVGADRLGALLATGVGTDSARVDRDILLTDGYFRLADALLGRRLDVASVYRRDWYPVLRSAATAELLRSALASGAPAAALSRVLADLRPADAEYGRLRAALARARHDDGTPAISAPEGVSPGDTSDVVLTLRRRLAQTGDWAGRQRLARADRVLDRPLAEALRRFQRRSGLPDSGELDQATIVALNTPGRDAAPLLAVNLERWRWLPNALGDRHVWVNIPAFDLELRQRADDGWRVERAMPVVVGSPGRWQTPVFSDTISQVVFNPTWTIPASIQMESYGRVDPRGMVRGPGPSNPLGRVKFAFPNPHGIFLHDTNARRRLQWEYRALSHGCIRLGDPQALAEDLLAQQEGWDSTRVASRFAGPWLTEAIALDRTVPVHLVYMTVRAARDGALTRLDDVYGWDRPLARALAYTDEELTASRQAMGGARR